MPTEISFVNFNSNPIMTVTDSHTGIIYIPCKPICEAIGVAWDAQRVKIQEDEVLNSVAIQITVTASDGKGYKTTCIPLDYLNGWLFKLNPSKVAPEARDRVITYQRECYRVLAKHFQGQSQPQLTKEEIALRKDELQVRKLEVAQQLPANPFLSHSQIQIITDNIADSFAVGKAENNLDKWIGCAQLAEEMGYKLNFSNRVKLGKALMNYELDRKRENRFCNGQYREINVYRECDELREAISDFFEYSVE
jgi:hypothetical protein